MMRFLSACAMGALFLLISPPLRAKLEAQVTSGMQAIINNAPYSYVGLGALVVVIFLTSLVRGSRVT
jgi:hypothetical protein